MNTSKNYELLISIGSDDHDSEIRDRIARQMGSEVRALGVDAKLVIGNSVPSNMRAGEEVVIGMLVLALTNTVLPKFLEFLNAWMLRGVNQSVKVKIADVEVEFPASMPAAEVQERIELVKQAALKVSSKQGNTSHGKS